MDKPEHPVNYGEVPRQEHQIARPDQVDRRPTVSLHLLAKNGESCVGRLLDNVGPYIDEVVVVLNDTTDDTQAIIEKFCTENDKDCRIVSVTAETHPQLYIQDTKVTYEVGRSLGGESFGGPYMEAPILADWSAIRNLGWDLCTKDWRLFLDVDDVVQDPESIPGLCRLLEDNHVELAATKYYFHVDEQGRPMGSSYRERLAVRSRDIRWIYPIHEVLAGTSKIAHIDGNLIVRDMRDNVGTNIRIPGRNFKVLYHHAREADWEVASRTVVNLIMEVRYMWKLPGMMAFATQLLGLYMSRSTWKEERGWALAMVGEMFEREGEYDQAIELYGRSLQEHPGAKTAFRMCRAYYSKGDWRSCVDVYKIGCEHKNVHQVLDDGPLFEDMSKILVAWSHYKLGDRETALKFCDEAAAAFPANKHVFTMRRMITGEISEIDGIRTVLEEVTGGVS